VQLAALDARCPECGERLESIADGPSVGGIVERLLTRCVLHGSFAVTVTVRRAPPSWLRGERTDGWG
jgi:hypothetical protein